VAVCASTGCGSAALTVIGVGLACVLVVVVPYCSSRDTRQTRKLHAALARQTGLTRQRLVPGTGRSALTALRIRTPGSGLTWRVTRVLENWTTPRYYDAVGTPAETRRFRVRVSGPLPGNLGKGRVRHDSPLLRRPPGLVDQSGGSGPWARLAPLLISGAGYQIPRS
jgi:hypothetical protein